MKTYINNLISEKGLDLETRIEVEGQSGTNSIPLQFVIDGIIATNEQEQQQIRNTLVKIDFHNGDIMHFFKHLAQALAI